ncbi:hypothetical protein H0H93_006089 [Arthromyces matolae]|nr:hypothetical protein H0H93_006089 [Arthromyces matolae]
MSLTLPVGIYLYIFRLAVCVPDAYDTSFDAVEKEVHETALDPILDAVATKTSLYLVSKSFSCLMEEILYGCICIFRVERIPALLDHLRRTPMGYNKPRGHLCRRLGLYLGVTCESSYLDESWYEGGHTFWGLIPACPRLEILIAHVLQKAVPWNMPVHFPHLTHNALWKTISTYCSRTLRRLELFGFSIRMDRVEIMLQCLTGLEVCRIVHCRPFSHFDFDHLNPFWSWNPHTYDDEEPTYRKHAQSIPGPERCTHQLVVAVQSRDDRTKSGLFKDEIVSEFDDALKNAQWPLHSDKVFLPHLHTLFLDNFTERFFDFNLPNLRKLVIEYVLRPDIIFNTTSTTTYGYGRPNFFWRLKTKTFPKPQGNHTIFGGFPETITHLDIPYHILTLERILFYFPQLTHLTWSDFIQFPMDVPPYMAKNTTLKCITINSHNNYGSIQNLLNSILDALRMKKVLALAEVSIDWKFWVDWEPPSLALTEFSEYGVLIRTSIVKPRRLTSHHF